MSKRMKIGIVIVIIMFMWSLNLVFAHPGRKDANGCHTCRTNCSDWGLQDGEYHCHNEGDKVYHNIHSGNNSSSNSTNKSEASGNTEVIEKKEEVNTPSVPESIITEPPKSSDTSIKTLYIDGENIEIVEEMQFQTQKDKVDIVVELNDSKATYKIENPSLIIGENIVKIIVTAEDGASKEYKIFVQREKIKNNTNIKLKVDNKIVEFIDGKAETYVSSSTEKLEYTYELEDIKATVEITEPETLVTGENRMYFKVTAEDGTTATYELKIIKYSVAEEIIGSILGIGILGGIFSFIKKRK